MFSNLKVFKFLTVINLKTTKFYSVFWYELYINPNI